MCKFLAGFLSCALLIVAVGLLSSSRAADWGVVTLHSHHFDNDKPKDYEQSNWGPGWEHDFSERWKAAVGMYRNSNRINSTYLTAVYSPLKYGPFKLGTAFGIVTGYSIEPQPAIIPVLMVEGSRLGFNITYVPRTSTNVPVIAWQVKVRF